MREKGSYLEWDQIWSRQSSADPLNPMYTESDPTTIFQFWQRAYANDLYNLIKDKGYTSFCELGSGRGTTSMYLAKRGYGDITLVDLSEQAFKVASHSFHHYNLARPRMLLADVEHTGLNSESFDCIYNIGLLEHFEDPKPALLESFRLLKNDGLIFMPIVPKLPFSRSIIHRIFFNPLSIAKHGVKYLMGSNVTADRGVNRTSIGKKDYIKFCESIGYRDIKCMSYNPFWKVNHDEHFLQKVVLPIYSWIYNRYMVGKTISFRTTSVFEVCYLLIAKK